MPGRPPALVLLLMVCVAGAGFAFAIAVTGCGTDGPTAGAASGGSAGTARLADGTKVLMRAINARGPLLSGRLVVVSGAGHAEPVKGAPSCTRVAFGGGRGLCMYLAASGVDFRVAILDSRLRAHTVLGLTGIPSRARVSPDGRMGAVTTFSTGDSYTSRPGAFSTRTTLIDLRKGKALTDLERWRFTSGGKPVDAVDRNFWGVTFAADGDHFYATMATGGHHYLVRGSIRAKGGVVVRDKVECPSLSPDGRRLAYKYPLGGGRWRLHVLDLRSGDDVALAERRSIDDQAAWIDDATVAYSDGKATWTAPADGGGTPQLLIRGADSPTDL